MADAKDNIVAIKLLKSENVGTLGSALKKIFMPDDTRSFDKLINALNDAERATLARA